jgi:hypothetical protein
MSEGDWVILIGFACGLALSVMAIRNTIGTDTKWWDRLLIGAWIGLLQFAPVTGLLYSRVTPLERGICLAELLLFIGFTAYLVHVRRASRD